MGIAGPERAAGTVAKDGRAQTGLQRSSDMSHQTHVGRSAMTRRSMWMGGTARAGFQPLHHSSFGIPTIVSQARSLVRDPQSFWLPSSAVLAVSIRLQTSLARPHGPPATADRPSKNHQRHPFLIPPGPLMPYSP